jgi:hypothetical protein
MNQVSKQNAQKLRNAIMRRVWYTYVLSVTLRQSTVWGVAFGASVIGFWKLVSITSIIQNFLNVPVGQAPTYILQSMMQAEFLALLAFGIIVFTLLSVGIRITLPVFTRDHKLSSI